MQIAEWPNFEPLPATLDNEVSTMIRLVTEEIAGWIRGQTPHGATDRLASGTGSEVGIRGDQFVGIVGNPLSYAEYILGEGAGPAVGHGQWWPPIEPLILWVRRKGLAGRYSMKSKKRLGSKEKKENEDERLAYAVQHKIHERGIKGHDLFNEAERRFGPKAFEMIANAVRKTEERFSD